MRIFGIGRKAVKLTEVFSRTKNTKTGTVIEKAMNNSHNRLTAGWSGMTDESAGVTRLISYGKKNTALSGRYSSGANYNFKQRNERL